MIKLKCDRLSGKWKVEGGTAESKQFVAPHNGDDPDSEHQEADADCRPGAGRALPPLPQRGRCRGQRLSQDRVHEQEDVHDLPGRDAVRVRQAVTSYIHRGSAQVGSLLLKNSVICFKKADFEFSPWNSNSK